MKKKLAAIVAALAASVSLMAFAGPASATTGCDYSEPELQYACNLFDFDAARDFDTSEATYWAGVGAQYGHTVEALALVHAVETDAELVNETYGAILDRAGDPAGVQFWTNQLASDSLMWEDIFGIFGDSGEGQAVLSNDEFTTVLYHAFLLRDPSTDELAYWSGVAASVSRHAVAIGISHSDEATNRLVGFYFQEILGRDATADDLTYWGGVLKQVGILDVVALLQGSDEAFANLSQVPAVAVAGALQNSARST